MRAAGQALFVSIGRCMSTDVNANPILTRHRLPHCVSAALFSNAAAPSSVASVSAPRSLERWRTIVPLVARLSAALTCLSVIPGIAATTWPVTTCGDAAGSTTTLRGVIAASTTLSGDTVDLTQLPTGCSTITLANGQISIPQETLTISGPTSTSVTIDGGAKSRVFYHSPASGTLYINYLTVTNGSYTTGRYGNGLGGGCIYSGSDVVLTHSAVTECAFTNTYAAPGYIGGGGIYAGSRRVTLNASTMSNNSITAKASGGEVAGAGILAGQVILTHSTVSGNSARGVTGTHLGGGGIYALTLFAKYSTLSGNSSLVGNSLFNPRSRGGALWVKNYAELSNCTVSDNVSNYGGAIWFEGGYGSYSLIRNSTISGNKADEGGGLEVAQNGNTADTLHIVNSTIAFNTAYGPDNPGGGIRVQNMNAIDLQSTIVSNNVGGSGSASSDIYKVLSDPVTITGSNNLIGAANFSLAGIAVSSADPKLGPLQFNGGPTLTHALMRGSLAIGAGNNTTGQTTDQRGTGYPRSTSAQTTDIGAFEFDAIFWNNFE
jgi:hypothetical protein